MCADSKYLTCLKSNGDYSVENRPIPARKVISKMLVTFERNEIEGWALRRSTQKCLRYQSTKLEFIVSSETIFQNCWSISRRKTDQLDQNKNYDNLVSFYSPNISLSNGENRRSLAASVHEIFKKYRVAFFFGADTSYS